MSNPVLVHVALGPNKDNTLVDFSRFASRNSNGMQSILVTDSPERYSDFPGIIIQYERSEQTERTLSRLYRSKPELIGLAGNYWFYTFERLLALGQIEQVVESATPILHIENDVLSFVDSEIMKLWQETFSKVTILRWSDLANAGALFAPNVESLKCFIELIHKSAQIGNLSEIWTIDMQILRSLLDDSKVCEFPTVLGIEHPKRLHLTSDLQHDNHRIICDSLDLGTYLLGRNSIYSNGVIRSGFRYDHIKWPIQDTCWKFENITSGFQYRQRMLMKFNNEIFVIPFIHVNSKLNLAALENSLLQELFPPNEWIKRPRFPTSGILAATVHKESRFGKVSRKLRSRLIRFCHLA